LVLKLGMEGWNWKIKFRGEKHTAIVICRGVFSIVFNENKLKNKFCVCENMLIMFELIKYDFFFCYLFITISNILCRGGHLSKLNYVKGMKIRKMSHHLDSWLLWTLTGHQRLLGKGVGYSKGKIKITLKHLR